MKAYTNSQIREIIDEYIHSDRDRRLLTARLVNGDVFEKLAEDFGLSDRQVKRIVYRLQEEVFKHL